MLLSELIKTLRTLKKEHGDISVLTAGVLVDDEGLYEVYLDFDDKELKLYTYTDEKTNKQVVYLKIGEASKTWQWYV